MRKILKITGILFGILVVFIIISAIFKPKTPTEFHSTPSNEVSRSFYMGFSAWPSDLNLKAIYKTLELTNANSDIRLAHFDGGVPWVEMAQNQPLPLPKKKTGMNPVLFFGAGRGNSALPHYRSASLSRAATNAFCKHLSTLNFG